MPERGNANGKGGDSLCVSVHYRQFGARLLYQCFLEEPRCCDGFRLPVTALREKTMHGRSLDFSRSGSARVLQLFFRPTAVFRSAGLVGRSAVLSLTGWGARLIDSLNPWLILLLENFPDRGSKRLWIVYQGSSWPGPMENKTSKIIQGAKEE